MRAQTTWHGRRHACRRQNMPMGAGGTAVTRCCETRRRGNVGHRHPRGSHEHTQRQLRAERGVNPPSRSRGSPWQESGLGQADSREACRETAPRARLCVSVDVVYLIYVPHRVRTGCTITHDLQDRQKRPGWPKAKDCGQAGLGVAMAVTGPFVFDLFRVLFMP